MKTYHVIDLPDGSATEGQVDLRSDPRYLGLEDCPLVAGSRVLDVGAFDGAWSFWAERKGAAYVLATDVEHAADYDWGINGPPASVLRRPRHDSAFFELKKIWNSKVERQALSVYELTPERHGEFDLVVFYGLLYHLRHPLLAFDRLRAVCRGAILVETHTPEISPKIPFTLFYRDDVLAKNPTNWCGPSEACVVSWMRDAGFEHVYYERPERKHKLRQRFVGVVAGSPWNAVFADNPNFKGATEAYFARSRALVERLFAKDLDAWHHGPR